MPEKISDEFRAQLWEQAACGRHAIKNDEETHDTACNYCTRNFVNLKHYAEHIVDLDIKIEQYQIEANETDELRTRLAHLLTGTANALHGGPMKNGSWSWHNLPELALDAMNRIADLEKPLPKNPLCKGSGDCHGICGGCMEVTTNLEYRLAYELVKLQESGKS